MVKQLVCPADYSEPGSKSREAKKLKLRMPRLWRRRYGNGSDRSPQKRTVAVNVTGEPEALSMAAVSL